MGLRHEDLAVNFEAADAEFLERLRVRVLLPVARLVKDDVREVDADVLGRGRDGCAVAEARVEHAVHAEHHLLLEAEAEAVGELRGGGSTDARLELGDPHAEVHVRPERHGRVPSMPRPVVLAHAVPVRRSHGIRRLERHLLHRPWRRRWNCQLRLRLCLRLRLRLRCTCAAPEQRRRRLERARASLEPRALLRRVRDAPTKAPPHLR
mmetsp:Transcript_1097/g.4060  ORF Transcript_1097/g.4060 Transcript_1097/m.4060 type:complete len:208 (+) Transcript_1097:117-740(+)